MQTVEDEDLFPTFRKFWYDSVIYSSVNATDIDELHDAEEKAPGAEEAEGAEEVENAKEAEEAEEEEDSETDSEDSVRENSEATISATDKVSETTNDVEEKHHSSNQGVQTSSTASERSSSPLRLSLSPERKKFKKEAKGTVTTVKKLEPHAKCYSSNTGNLLNNGSWSKDCRKTSFTQRFTKSYGFDNWFQKMAFFKKRPFLQRYRQNRRNTKTLLAG